MLGNVYFLSASLLQVGISPPLWFSYQLSLDISRRRSCIDLRLRWYSSFQTKHKITVFKMCTNLTNTILLARDQSRIVRY